MSNPTETEEPRGEQWGQGGRYEIRDGVRVRVEEPTAMPDPNAKQEPAPAGEQE